MDLKPLKPAAITQALEPYIYEKDPVQDKFIGVKEQYLLEKYHLNQQIERSNQKQKIVQQVLKVNRPSYKQFKINRDASNRSDVTFQRENKEGDIYTYVNKTNDKDFRYKKFNSLLQRINDLNESIWNKKEWLIA